MQLIGCTREIVSVTTQKLDLFKIRLFYVANINDNITALFTSVQPTLLSNQFNTSHLHSLQFGLFVRGFKRFCRISFYILLYELHIHLILLVTPNKKLFIWHVSTVTSIEKRCHNGSSNL